MLLRRERRLSGRTSPSPLTNTLSACAPKLGDVADKDGVWRVWDELAVRFVVSNAIYSSCAGNIWPRLADLGPKPRLAHEFVDEFVVDHPTLVAQSQKHPTVAVAMLVGLEASRKASLIAACLSGSLSRFWCRKTSTVGYPLPRGGTSSGGET